MSLCRFSSDDFQCDVYVYASAHGFETHVAANRVVFREDPPPPVSLDDPYAWVGRHQKVMEMVRDADREDIGLEYDGESFTDPDAASCASRLRSLRDAGYNVPDYAIQALEEEAESP